jgi:hypothetical protein
MIAGSSHKKKKVSSDLGGELPLEMIHLFIHQLTNEKMKNYCVKISYGSIDENTNVFFENKEGTKYLHENKKPFPFQSNLIETYVKFKYIPGSNFVKIELFDPLLLQEYLLRKR